MATQVTPESPVQVKRRKYNRLMTEAEIVYHQTVRAIEAAFEEATVPAREKLDDAIEPHQREFDKTTADAAKARDAAIREADAKHANAHTEASKAAGFTS